MAVNTIDYSVNLDISQLGTRAHEIRSTLSGVFAGAAGGLAQFGGAAASGAAMMQASMARGMGAVQSFTDPAMAYQAHYGMVRAQSQLGQEWAAYNRGAAGVAGFTPPGVGAGAYAAQLQQNFAQRVQRGAMGFARGAIPMAAELVAWRTGGAIGEAIGGTIGGIAGGLVLGAAAGHVVSKGIERGEKIFAEVNQLGQIATAGRGMTVGQTQQFGRGFRAMAQRMNVSANEMGDILSGIRGMGMMPKTRDVKQALSQFEGMAKDIREIAVGMQTSLANATRLLKDVEQLGLGRGAGGVTGAAGMAAGLGTSLRRLIGHVRMGQRVGMAAQIGGGVGGGVFLQAAQAGARGLGALQGPERRMVGGAMGLGRAFGMQAMQSALGPTGQMQLMAMMGPRGARALPTTMMGTLNQAARNIFGGGAPVANMVEFITNRRRMLRKLGPTGIRQMQAQSIATEAKMLQKMFPSIGRQRSLQMTAMNRGLSEHQARGMAGYIMRGFKAQRPAARAVGLPGVFGGGRAAQASIRASVDVAARQAARQSAVKMPWTRVVEGIGNWWARTRQRVARSSADFIRTRQREQGILMPRAADIRSVQRGLQRGQGILAGAGITTGAMGGRGAAAMQTVLAFGGARATGGVAGGIAMPGGRVIRAREAGRALTAIGTQLGRLSRGSVSQSAITQASVVIGSRIEGGKLDAKKTAENLRWNLRKSTGGSGDKTGRALQNLTHDIGQVLKGTEFEKGFKKQGIAIFGSKKGAEAMATINRFMRAQGQTGFDIGKALKAAGARGMAGAALAVRTRATGILSRLMGGRDVEAEAKSIVTAAQRARRRQRASGVPTSGAERGLEGDIVLVPTMAQARVMAEQRLAKEGKKSASQIVQSKSFRDYVKTRDRLYYQPWRQARAEAGKKFTAKTADQRKSREDWIKTRAEQLKKQARAKTPAKLERAKRAAVLIEARASMKPGASEAAKRMVRTMDKDKKVSQDIASAVNAVAGDSKKRATRGKRPRGRTVAFQSQAQSFQSQVAQVLRKNTLALSQIQSTMKAMEDRLKTGKSS